MNESIMFLKEWDHIYVQINRLINEYRSENIQDHLKSHFTNKLENIKKRCDDYISQLPVIGFNSGKYDINLIANILYYL